MRITKQQLRRIIREAIRPHNFNGEHGDVNDLLQMYLIGDLDEEELQYLRETMSPGDIDEIITIYERLIAILRPLAER